MADSDGGIETLRTSMRKAASRNPATEKLWQETEDYLDARFHWWLASLGRRLGEATNKLTRMPSDGKERESGIPAGTGKLSSAVRSAATTGMQGIKERAADVTKAVDPRKLTSELRTDRQESITIAEDVDVGVPVRQAYLQWLRFQEFVSSTRGDVGSEEDVTSNGKVRIGLPRRAWEATVTEQVQDELTAWRFEGAEGTIRGFVTFHSLGDHLTRVLHTIDYCPHGMRQRIGIRCRALSHRVRHDLRRYRAFVMAHEQATGGWRNEIHDSEGDREEIIAAEEGTESTREAEEGAAPAEEEAAAGEQERAEEETGYGDETGEVEAGPEQDERGQYDDWAEYEPDEEEYERGGASLES